MADIVVLPESRDRLGRVQPCQLQDAVELDPDRGLHGSRLLPGQYLRQGRELRRVVALGGGTGLPVVLEGLRRLLPADCRITAIVTAADNGGSSGALREAYGVLPPGDIRNCLLALARVAPEVSAALRCRFDGTGGREHPVGNLLLTALDMVAADEITSIRLAATLLGVEDIILPSTTARVHLEADLVDGRSIRGEAEIRRAGARIARLRIDPPGILPAPGVLEALRAADVVILAPGSLYTSILATLIIPGVIEALTAARGVRILVCNLMTEPGETDGYGVAAHLEALNTHGLPPHALDYVVVNTGPLPPEVQARYAAAGAETVQTDFASSSGSPLVVASDLLDRGPVVRHAPDKLATILWELAVGHLRLQASEG